MKLSGGRPVLSSETRSVKDAIGEVAIDALDSHSMRHVDRTSVPSRRASVRLVPSDDEVVDRAHQTPRVRLQPRLQQLADLRRLLTCHPHDCAVGVGLPAGRRP